MSRIELGFARTECACNKCQKNCRFMPGYLIPADLPRLAKSDDPIEILKWAIEHLSVSKGATVGLANGETFQIETLVPDRNGEWQCHWLNVFGQCSVHKDAPFGCAFFDCKQTREEADARSRQGLIEIMKDDYIRGIYSRVLNALREFKPATKTPIEARRAMAEQP